MPELFGKTILLVEDEAIIALTEKAQLSKYGYSVKHAVSGESAVRAVAEDPSIDLVLMDINLGDGIDGTEAAERILRLRDVPVLFLSSHIEREVVERTERITSYGYVVKSSSITVLDASIKMAFKLHSARRELERHAELVHERSQLLENVIEHFPGVIYWKDSSYAYQGCSTAFALDAGLASPRDVVGKTDFDLAWKDHEARFYRSVDETIIGLQENRMHVEETQHTHDGSVVWYDTCKIPLFGPDGTVSGVLGVSLDITERKKLETELVRLKTAVDASPLAIVVTDAAGTIEYVNARLCELTGYGREELLGRNPRIFKSGKTPGAVYADLWDTIAAGGEWSGAFRNRRKSGDEYDELARIVPVRSDRGQILSYIAMKEDITARLYLDKRLAAPDA